MHKNEIESSLGIEAIGYALGNKVLDNLARAKEYDKEISFVKEKIGFHTLRRLDENQSALSLCIDAFNHLKTLENFEKDECSCIVVVTQNPNNNSTVPHLSALVHEQLGMPEHTACFDVSLGCSGYVYALNIITAFMQANAFTKGLIFTSDPYSPYLKDDDAQNQLLFGDAATCSLISDKSHYVLGKSLFATQGNAHKALMMNEERIISMKGREVFNFTMTSVPKQLEECLEKNALNKDEIDCLLLHQASKYIVENIAKRINFPPEKAPFVLDSIGNCVSSTIPLALAQIWAKNYSRLLLSGFGVGLSWASTVLYKQGE